MLSSIIMFVLIGIVYATRWCLKEQVYIIHEIYYLHFIVVKQRDWIDRESEHYESITREFYLTYEKEINHGPFQSTTNIRDIQAIIASLAPPNHIVYLNSEIKLSDAFKLETNLMYATLIWQDSNGHK